MRASRTGEVCLALALSLLSSVASAQTDTGERDRVTERLAVPGGLTADAVARAAASSSYEVRARQEDFNAAQSAATQAWVAFLPRVGVSARYSRLSPIDPANLGMLVAAPQSGAGPIAQGSPLVNVPLSIPFPTDQTVTQATLTVPLTDYAFRIPQTYAAARDSERAAEETVQATRLRVASDARVAYYQWVRARLQGAVAEQALAQARAHLTDVQRVFEAGSASRADVLRVESQVAGAELLVARAATLEHVSADRVRTLMHVPASTPLAIGEDLREDVTRSETATESLVDEGMAQRLEVRALRTQASALDNTARSLRSTMFPRIDAVAETTYANPNPRIFPQTDRWTATWSVGVQLSWSPNDLAGANAASRAQEARTAALRAQEVVVREGVRAEVVGAREALEESRASLASTARALASAEEGLRVRRALFREGRATSTEMTDSETELVRAQLEAVNARIDARLATVRLSHATGRDVGQRP